MRPVEGVLDGETVAVEDDQSASRLINKGSFGVPQSGGSLRMHLLEAIYLVDKGRMDIVTKDGGLTAQVRHEEVLSLAVQTVPGFEVRYAVYRDLRERGYILASPLLLVKGDGTFPDWDLEAYSRGTMPGGKRRPQIRIFSISERAPMVLGDVIDRVGRATAPGLKVFLSIVDEEGDLTYYEVRTKEPSGSVRTKGKGPFEAHLLEDRVVVTGEGVKELFEDGFYGKVTGEKLQLSFLEAAYLLERGQIQIRNARTRRNMGLKAFMRMAAKRQSDFKERLQAYTDLRERGMVVKTGFKYGTHFRVYEGDPTNHHARYLMHAVPEAFATTWPEMSRAVRLAHGVRKEILLTRVRGKGVQYIQFKRIRP
jgi:tRNA-intron endonuclease